MLRSTRLRSVIFTIAAFALPSLLLAADCSGNRILDSRDIAGGQSSDCNGNGIPDECDLHAWTLAFKTTRAFLLGSGASHVEAADLDGDGDLDLIASQPSYGAPSNWTTASVIWKLGRRSFSPPLILPVALAIFATSADLDGDRDLDLVVAHGQPVSLTILLNDGKGSFAPKMEIESVAPVSAVRAADLNGDGIPDLVLSSFSGTALTILLSRGPLDYAPPGHVFGHGPFEIEDLDGDGHRDLVVLVGTSQIAVHWNDGQGAYPTRTILKGAAGFTSLALLDLDGDQVLDLAAGGNTEVTTYLNRGRDRIDLIQELMVDRAWYLAGLDADGDGDFDLVVASNLSGLLWFENDGGGSLSEIGTVIPTLSSPISPVPLDLDGDGLQDLLWSDGDAVFVSFQEIGGFPQEAPQRIPTHRNGDSILPGDWSGDGRLDLIVAGENSLITLLNDGAGGLREGETTGLGASGFPWTIIPGDFDRDGDLDLILDSAQGVITLLKNQGDGKFTDRIDSPIPGALLISRFGADLDGDRDLDLLVRTLRTFSVLLNHGDGTFEVGNEYEVPETYFRVAIGDVDEDGFNDLIFSGILVGSVWIYLNDGHGAFDLTETIPVGQELRAPAVLADLDGDRHLDLAVICSGPCAPGDPVPSSQLVFLRGNGKGSFEMGETLRLLSPLEQPDWMDSADFNGDGLLDLVVSFFSDPFIYVLLNRGDGTFIHKSAFQHLSSRGGHLTIAVPDLDSDGRAEILVADPGNYSGGQFILHQNLTPPARSQDLDQNGIPDECARVHFHRGDVDGGGTLEVTDAILLLDHLFGGGAAPACLEAADADNDGALSVTDAVLLLGYLFLAGPPPVPPGPPPAPCGIDPDVPGAAGDLGCGEYHGC